MTIDGTVLDVQDDFQELSCFEKIGDKLRSLINGICQAVISAFEWIKNLPHAMRRFIESFRHSKLPVTAEEQEKDSIRNGPWSKLNDAAYFGKNHQLIKMLATHDVNEKDLDGSTAAHAAALGGNVEGLALLCQTGADINAENMDGDTPMHLAARRGHTFVISFLALQGAKIDQKNEYENTPLRLAAEFGHSGVIASLVALGADREALDARKQTPYFVARLEGRMAVANFLLTVGANKDVVNIDGKKADDIPGRAGPWAYLRYLLSMDYR